MSGGRDDEPGLTGQPKRQEGPEARAARVSLVFDGARLTQGRFLHGMSKTALAAELGVTPTAIAQYESNTAKPRPRHVMTLSTVLDVPIDYFAAGRPHVRLDRQAMHFHSLRSTRVGQRLKALAFVEQVWELLAALEEEVELPEVDLPFIGEEIGPATSPVDPVMAAREVRYRWGYGRRPVEHLVRDMERRGLIVTMVNFAGSETPRINAFSTSTLGRPLVVLTPDRQDDVFAHRWSAAHELGHLVLHHSSSEESVRREREANAFAAELLTPRDAVAPDLGSRVDFARLQSVSEKWGVSIKSLIFRSQELGLLSEASARRAYIRHSQLRASGLVQDRPIRHSPGEVPTVLGDAFALAESCGLTESRLLSKLQWRRERLHLLLGKPAMPARPRLRLV